jgi:hypothetical protein
MSNEAPNWFREQWDAAVTHVYQSKGYLTRGMTMGPSKIEGKKLHFPIAGKGEASETGRGDEVKPMNAMRGEVQLDSKSFDAGDHIYIEDLDKMAPNEIDVVRETAAAALGRKHDTILFDLFRNLALPNAGVGSQVFGAYNDTKLPGPKLILKARRRLFNSDVPIEDGMIFCGMPPLVFDDMMSYEVFSNSLYVGPKMPWAEGQRARTWQNVHCFELPMHLQTTPAENQGKFFMWHKSSVGSGYTGEQTRTEFEKEVRRKRWWYQSSINGGVTVIQTPGIMEVRFNAALEPEFS